MARRRRSTGGPRRGFQAIKEHGVAQIEARGGKTAHGETIRDPEAYMAGGLRRTGIRKLGAAGFKARQAAGRRKARGRWVKVR